MVDELAQALPIQRRSLTEPALAAYGNEDLQSPTVDAMYHANSRLTPATEGAFTRSTGQFMDDPGRMHALVHRPDYPFNESVDLPAAPGDLDVPISDALQNRRSDVTVATAPLDTEMIGSLLDLAIGICDERTIPSSEFDVRTDKTTANRTYPSAGRLYPIEFYLVVRSVPGIEPGAYYYVPESHELRVVERFDDPSRFDELFYQGSESVGAADAAVLMANVRSRVHGKYGPRAYRFSLVEAGHAGQNLQLVATAIGLGSTPHGGYYDDEIEDCLDLDGLNAGVVNAMLFAGDDTAGTEDGGNAR